MGYAEDIIRLRQRMQDAVAKGVVSEDGKGIMEAALIQVMNEAEKNRQNCLTQAENLKKQAATAEGQAGAFSSVISIIYNVLNGFVNAAEKAEVEEARVAAEKAEREAAMAQMPDSQENQEHHEEKKKMLKKK